MTTTSHISTSGGLISTAFIENIRQAQTNQRGTHPDTFAVPGEDAPKSPAVLEAKIAETWEALLERWDAMATELPHMEISQARDRWMLPLLRALDFQPIYQRSDILFDDSEALRFNVSHFGWEKTGFRGSGLGVGEKDESRTPNPEPPPLHTVPPTADLDARPAGATSSRSAKGKAPHDMVQLFLNVSRDHRWAVLTNGLHLRLLRDYHHTYTKGYVQFDLESIFETRNFADFRALYRMAHASRFIGPEQTLEVSETSEVSEVESWESVPLEMFYRDSQAAGIQVGTDLQKQVREAIETLGNGFLSGGSGFGLRGSGKDANPEPRTTNPSSLLEALQTDSSLCQQFYAELLHIVYRVLFLLYAEQRGMVPQSGAPLDSLYRQSYSLTALRRKAESDPASPEAYDLWEGLKVTFKMFRQGADELGVYRYNGMLFAEDQTPLLDGSSSSGFGIRASGKDTNPEPPTPNHQSLRCRNYELLRALRALTLIEREGVLQRISYADLNVEEIGGIYESLLDFAPRVTTTAEAVDGREIPPHTFFLDPRGTARKTTGSYYTHPSLVNALVESALIPVLNQRVAEAVSGSGLGVRGSGKESTSHEPQTPQHETELEEEDHDQSAKLPGSAGLADGDEVGNRDIRGDKTVSSERTVRSDQPVASGGGLDSGEHRRGIRTAHDEGLSQLSDDSPRLDDGSGDSTTDQPQPGLSEKERSAESIGTDRSFGTIPERPYEFPTTQELGISGSGLGIGDSGETTTHEPRTPNSEPRTPDYQFLTDEQRKAAIDAILSLKVCDPAMGSGHFLIAANNALALRLAQIRTGDEYPAERALRQARRDVLAHCIYGVDLNPMAVELCKVALWINAAVDDAPLSFLDHHLKVGNSLLGATPELLEQGIPYDAFALGRTGDDREIAKALRNRNRQERRDVESGGGFQPSLFQVTVLETLDDVRQYFEVDQLAADQPQLARERYAEYRTGSDYRRQKLLADFWTAAFFWPMPDPATCDHDRCGLHGSNGELLAPTYGEFLRLREEGPDALPPDMLDRVARLAEEHNFFHWHLEFPDVFGDRGLGESRGSGIGIGASENDTNHESLTPNPEKTNPENHGFDVVLGNPPWERLNLEEKQFFAQVRPDIASAGTTQRRKLIRRLATEDEELFSAYKDAKRQADSEINFALNSGFFLSTLKLV